MKNGSSFQVYIMWLIGILEGLQDDFRRVLEKRYNLSKYILSCCSTADITKEHFEKIDVKYLCFHFEIDGQEYYDDLGESMALSEFYGRMEKGAMTKTSQPNAQEYKDFFSKYLEEGYDVLHLCLTSGISGAFNSANIAASMLREEFPERKIYIVDSLTASSGYGMFMETLAEMRDAGTGIDELRDWAEANKKRVRLWFFTSELKYLVRGGRVSKAAGAIGSALNICPMLEVDANGALSVRAKIRTKKKAMAALVGKMEELADDGLDYSGKCYVFHSASLEDCKVLADMINDKFKNLKEYPEIDQVGTTIGSHTGPGLLAVGFWGKERTE